jgi:hypothetical protein
MSPVAGSSPYLLLRHKLLMAGQKIGLHLIELIRFLNRNDMGIENLRSSKLAL